ncbi:MAG: hypothetical protein ACI9IV_001882 [Paracoccaceae bacterium]|jgi:uncharacterized protein GlcG (DUF336 family)
MPRLTLKRSRKIIKTALAKADELELKPLAVVVLDDGGHVVAVERSDGASAGRFDVARAKAYGCIMLGIGGYAMRERAEQQSYFLTAVNGALDGKLVPVPGGVLIRDKTGLLIGAVGISGDTGENDATCAVAGIENAGLVAEA